jgi:exonuclease SbcC
MFIRSLTLKNIRSYKEQTITFPKGIVLLSGDIGSGKSTILQAIEFALFGAQRGILDAATLLRHGETHGEVTLECDIATITRTLKSTKQGVQQGPGILKTTTAEDLAPTELRARVLALLGYPENPATFRYTVYASQEQMKQIILERPEARLDILRTIFGVDKYKHIQNSIDIIQKYIRKDRTLLEGQLLDFGKKKIELADLQTHLQTISVDSSKKDLDIAKSAYEQIETMFESLRELHQKHELRVQELGLSEKEFANLHLETLYEKKMLLANELRELQKMHDEIHVAPFDIDTTRSELMSLKDLIARQQTQLASLKERKQLYEKQIKNAPLYENIDEAYGSKKNEYESLENQYKKQLDTLSRKKHLEQQIAEYIAKKKAISILDVCSTCGQKVTESHKSHMCAETNTRVLNMENELRTLNIDTDLDAKKLRVKQELDSIERKRAEAEAAKKRLAEIQILQKEVLVLSEKIAALEKIDHNSQLQDLEKKYADAQALQKLQEKKLHIAISIKEKTFALDDLVKRIVEQELAQKKLSEKISVLAKEISLYTIAPFERAKADRAKALETYRHAESTYTKVTTEHAMLTKQITQLSEEVTQKRAAKKHRDWLDSESQWLKTFFGPLVTQIEKRVLAQIHAEFNTTFSHWFSQLIEDPSFSASVDMFFTPAITQNEYDVALSGLSGGERTSVAFAYRLALYSAVKSLVPFATSGLLILDEPTEGFSTEQLDRVRDVLRLLGVSQLLIVSHEQHVEGFADSVIRIHKGGSESSVM